MLFCNANIALASELIKIGSGSVLESYYPVALKLCAFIKKSNKGVMCDVVPTTGTVENLRLLKEGKIDLAIAQSDVALDAFRGTGMYSGQVPMTTLSQVLTLHDEIFTVIVKDSDHIKVFGDIDGKRISNGQPLSASSSTYETLSKLYDFATKPVDIELNHDEYATKFCSGEVDVLIVMTGHPSALVNHIANGCEIDFVSIERNKIDRIIHDNPAFKKTILNKGLYPGISEDQNTIATSAILVGTDKIKTDLLKNFLKYFNHHILEFKKSTPTLHDLSDSHFMENFVLPPNHSVHSE